MAKLNLPEKFREIEEWLSECEAMTKADYHKTTHSAITLTQARELFTALSEAREEIERLNEQMYNLIKTTGAEAKAYHDEIFNLKAEVERLKGKK